LEYILVRRIVLVEDDIKLANLVKGFLTQHSFEVTVVNNGAEAVEQITSINPDIVLLDIMLPEVDGFTIFRALKDVFTNPILFISAKDSAIDQVMGLEMGADDYIVKPVDPHVLLARINLMLRKSVKSTTGVSQLRFGKLEIHKHDRLVTLDAENIELTSHEFELLWLLAEQAGTPLNREHIHREMIGREYDGLDRTVDVRISKLRKKLGDNVNKPIRLKTVWGKGYMLCPDAWE
jgi:two-component system OmpR family response regulator/two-component system response regulator RstA